MTDKQIELYKVAILIIALAIFLPILKIILLWAQS